MHPLLRKALLRLLLFYLYGLFVAWIFTLIERKDESHHNRMERTLNELRKEMDLKYNITDNDFESFVRRAGIATMEDEELDWTFLNSCGFVFAALTTIGKVHRHGTMLSLKTAYFYSFNSHRLLEKELEKD